MNRHSHNMPHIFACQEVFLKKSVAFKHFCCARAVERLSDQGRSRGISCGGTRWINEERGERPHFCEAKSRRRHARPEQYEPASGQFFSALLHRRNLSICILLPALRRRKAKFATPCIRARCLHQSLRLLSPTNRARSPPKILSAEIPRCAALWGPRSNIIRKSLALRCEQFCASRFLVEQGSRCR